MKVKYVNQILVEFSNIKFNKNSFSVSSGYYEYKGTGGQMKRAGRYGET